MFHADGIRMDGVSSMLYLNFGVDNPADKKFNEYGTEEDLDASAFIRQVNPTGRNAPFPDVMMMAEESTAWPLVTYPAEDGGLSFHYKWDMGWMNDTLHYMQTDFPWRPGNHGLLTFSLMYAYSENYILPLSHDEVVHGKCSLIGRMPGDWWRQFAGLRTLAFWQMTHPGAKLNFMGNEIAQFIEWRYYESIRWFLAEEHETHAKHREFIRRSTTCTPPSRRSTSTPTRPKGSNGSTRTTRSSPSSPTCAMARRPPTTSSSSSTSTPPTTRPIA